MSGGVEVKICGLSEPETLRAAVDAGARFVGFVFYPNSPRYVEPEIAKALALQLPTGVRAVGLFVNPSDGELEAVLGRVQLDMIQLHGDEGAARVAEVKARFGVQVMKALPIKGEEDLKRIAAYEEVVDWVLCDTPSAGFGGSGEAFDWSILAGYDFKRPWMLAGGLSPENVAEAIALLAPSAVDVSSGVEAARGVKEAGKIKAFIEAVKSA